MRLGLFVAVVLLVTGGSALLLGIAFFVVSMRREEKPAIAPMITFLLIGLLACGVGLLMLQAVPARVVSDFNVGPAR